MSVVNTCHPSYEFVIKVSVITTCHPSNEFVLKGVLLIRVLPVCCTWRCWCRQFQSTAGLPENSSTHWPAAHHEHASIHTHVYTNTHSDVRTGVWYWYVQTHIRLKDKHMICRHSLATIETHPHGQSVSMTQCHISTRRWCISTLEYRPMHVRQ